MGQQREAQQKAYQEMNALRDLKSVTHATLVKKVR